MPLEDSPYFRKAVLPWYDSTALCVVLLVAMGLVAGFAFVGVGVSNENPDYHGFVWVPLTLLTLSATVTVSVLLRLLRRCTRRQSRSGF